MLLYWLIIVTFCPIELVFFWEIWNKQQQKHPRKATTRSTQTLNLTNLSAKLGLKWVNIYFVDARRGESNGSGQAAMPGNSQQCRQRENTKALHYVCTSTCTCAPTCTCTCCTCTAWAEGKHQTLACTALYLHMYLKFYLHCLGNTGRGKTARALIS